MTDHDSGDCQSLAAGASWVPSSGAAAAAHAGERRLLFLRKLGLRQFARPEAETAELAVELIASALGSRIL